MADKSLDRKEVSRKPIVRVVPCQPHCFAFGGFELQMIGAMEAARTENVDIAPLDFWRKEPDFDILHVWGLGLQHIETVKWAHLAGKKILLTALVNDLSWQCWVRFVASYLLGPARLRKPMLKQVNGITVVNYQQKESLISTYRVSSEKVFVVPNIVESIFFTAPKHAENFDPGIDNYVICVGNICKRKNQLILIKACRKIGVPLLLIGNVLTGEEDYGYAVTEAMANDSKIRWIRGLPPGSNELAAAYSHAILFALLSYGEQQPISALEAAAARKPLVLADRPYSKQEYYLNAALANPNIVDHVVDSIRKVLDRPDAYCPPIEIVERCRKDKVGASYAAVYQKFVL